ncbi:MAG TPA: hypothetical protein VGY77_01790, partial [Gemmataceae bacterium]|nr:hypothetical protein [Gemmataceae bacterium]
MSGSLSDLVKAPAASSAPKPPQGGSELATRLTQEMRARWEQGERPITEEFLALYPALWNQPESAIELIYEETCLRKEHGQELSRRDLL